MGVPPTSCLEKHPKMRLPVQVLLCVFLSIIIQQDRMKGNAKRTTTPLKEDPEFYDATDESLQLTIADKTSRAVKFEKASKQQLWKVLLEMVEKLRRKTKKSVSENKQHIDDIKNANAALCAIGNIGNGPQGLSGPVIVYDTLYQETNGASCTLDISTGKFTAGRSGVYQISVNSPYGKTKDNTYIFVYLRTSSGSYQDDHEAKIAYQSADGTSFLRTPLNTIRFISLQQGETAWLEYYCNAGLTSTSCGIHKIKFCVSLYK